MSLTDLRPARATLSLHFHVASQDHHGHQHNRPPPCTRALTAIRIAFGHPTRPRHELGSNKHSNTNTKTSVEVLPVCQISLHHAGHWSLVAHLAAVDRHFTGGRSARTVSARSPESFLQTHRFAALRVLGTLTVGRSTISVPKTQHNISLLGVRVCLGVKVSTNLQKSPRHSKNCCKMQQIHLRPPGTNLICPHAARGRGESRRIGGGGWF